MGKAALALLTAGSLLSLACAAPLRLPALGLRARAQLTPEHLLAVLPEPGDLPGGPEQEWWAGLPQFNAGLAGPGTLAGERFWVARRLEGLGQAEVTHLETALTLYESDAAAARAFRVWASTLDRGGERVEGPPLADEHRYFTRRSSSRGPETTLRLRLGPVAGRVSAYARESFVPSGELAGYARRMVDELGSLLGGELHAAPLRADLLELLPPQGMAPGPILGSAVVPTESWALDDPFRDPIRVRDVLEQLGASQLGFRRYRLTAEQGHVLEVTLFPFASEPAARLWLELFASLSLVEGELDAGQSGDLALFRQWPSGEYQLRFVKGPYAGDLLCYAPFGQTSPACEEAVRRLAEAWFGALPGP